MNQLASNLIVLEPGQTPPSDALFPPRQPKWFDTFAYIANPDQFCHENFKRYGPIFRTGVFGGTTVLVGSTQANQMVFNGDLNYTEIGLPATTMAMFGEYSLFQFKKGWGLIAEPRIAHIMPEHFHEPAHFAPERFLGDRNEGKMYEFIPFGGGIHSCLGAQLTFLVSKIFAFHVLRQFEWNLVGKARFVQFPLKRLRDDYCIELKGRHNL